MTTTRTRRIAIDIVGGAPPVHRRYLTRTEPLDLVQVRVLETPDQISHAAFATRDGLDLLRVRTPTWIQTNLTRLLSAVDHVPHAEITVRGVRMHVWLRSAEYTLSHTPRVRLGDAEMVPATVDVADPGRLKVRGHLIARTGDTGHQVERTFTADTAPPWLLRTLTTDLQDAR